MVWPAAPTAASRARRARVQTEEPIRSAVFTGNLAVIRTAVTFNSVSDSPSKQCRARKQAALYRRSNVAWPGLGRQNKVAKDQRIKGAKRIEILSAPLILCPLLFS